MLGIIKNYLPAKQYGFIRGEDDRDYFFHKNEIINFSSEQIYDGASIEFEGDVNSKGYIAKGCRLTSDLINTYQVPYNSLCSKSSSIRGWEILSVADYLVTGNTYESRESPDNAKDELCVKAKRVGANAVINMKYSKSTGSYGNYDYTLHHFTGQPVFIGKKDPSGRVTIRSVPNINEKALRLYDRHLEHKSIYESKMTRYRFFEKLFISIFMLALLTCFLSIFRPFGFFIGLNPFVVFPVCIGVCFISLFIKLFINAPELDDWIRPCYR